MLEEVKLFPLHLCPMHWKEKSAKISAAIKTWVKLAFDAAFA